MNGPVQEPCPAVVAAAALSSAAAPAPTAAEAVPAAGLSPSQVFHRDTAAPAQCRGISRGRRRLLQALALGCALPVGAPRAMPEGLPALAPVAPGLWRLPVADGAEPDAGNGGQTVQLMLARDDDGRGWLVGSGPSPAFGQRLGVALQADGLPPVAAVVHTRAHPALALGNAAFPAATAWALRAVAAQMAAHCADCVARLRTALGDAADPTLAPGAVRVPQALVDPDGATEGRLGPFDWHGLSRGPEAPLLLLRHRASGVVLAQGLLWAGAVPSLAEADGDAMAVAWQGLLQALGPRGVAVGEQGPPAGAAAVRRHLDYLDTLGAAVDARLQAGDSEAGAAAAVVLPAFAALPGYRRRHPLNVQRLWRAREAALLQQRPPAPR